MKIYVIISPRKFPVIIGNIIGYNNKKIAEEIISQ